jgi:signal transduction histidine kinase
MRWPLRRQIMLPMAAIMLLTVLTLGGVGAMLAVRATKARIAVQIAGVTRILQTSNFPLTDAVLRQMKDLSGAEMFVLDDDARLISTSGSARQFLPLISRQPRAERDRPVISLGDRLWTRNGGFFHTVMPLAGRRSADRATTLHIFYPEEDYRRAWQRAVYPSLALVALALPAVMLLAGLTASRISRRMSRLQQQVDHIAHGDFQQLALSDRDDEIRALGEAVNRMAAMLARYEDDVRRTERMRTLAHLGGGIAHQLRNSATGCRIALDLHAEQCSTDDDDECLAVAKTQLRLMDEYIQRFLRLGKPSHGRSAANVDLAALVDELVPLVRPAARHAGVTLDWQMPTDHVTVTGDTATLTQLVINLLINAIEAAAQGSLQSHAPGRVCVALSKPSADQILLTVSDSGPGPPDDVRDRLFEPFVTSKVDGAGLGLSVARDVAQQHGGRLFWQRVGDMTQFCVELPAIPAADASSENVEMQCV